MVGLEGLGPILRARWQGNLSVEEERFLVYAEEFDANENFEATLDAAKTGADWAWAKLYGELAGAVTGYLRTRGASDPDDLCSETFLQVARGIQTFSGDETSFRSWVFVIAHRRLIDSRRTASRRLETVDDPDGIEQLPLAGSVDDDAIDNISSDRVWQLFQNLTADQRDVLALRVIGDLSLEQAAKVLNKSVGAVKALQRRALASLRRDLGVAVTL